PYLEEVEDFTPYLERLKRRGVGLVFIAGLDAGAGRIITQARKVGLAARFLGGDGLEPLAAQGSSYNGTMVGALYHPESSAAAGDFAAAFREKYNREADGFAAAAYDAVHLLALAAETAGAERTAIQRYLAGVGQEGGQSAFAGATGTIRFDENGDPMNKDFTVGVIRDGTIQLVGSSR
ncbi:MAG: ABC transporter substrate-binding protein, partial [Gemmatimonadota bacterium]|nr:ABC transporter substrate-binding protein [Gemmatimonadota bacterium]